MLVFILKQSEGQIVDSLGHDSMFMTVCELRTILMLEKSSELGKVNVN